MQCRLQLSVYPLISIRAVLVQCNGVQIVLFLSKHVPLNNVIFLPGTTFLVYQQDKKVTVYYKKGLTAYIRQQISLTSEYTQILRYFNKVVDKRRVNQTNK